MEFVFDGMEGGGGGEGVGGGGGGGGGVGEMLFFKFVFSSNLYIRFNIFV
jgi:hypothetical protein